MDWRSLKILEHPGSSHCGQGAALALIGTTKKYRRGWDDGLPNLICFGHDVLALEVVGEHIQPIHLLATSVVIAALDGAV